jgi:hypothetical protein
MEKVNERRRFVKGIGFFAAILGGGSALGAANTLPVAVPTVDGLPATNGSSNPVSEPVVEDISHLAPPEGATTIQITGAYGEKPKPQPVSSTFGDSYYINGFNQETTHRVSMTVGLDNRLWIKIGDTWKRVAIEG